MNMNNRRDIAAIIPTIAPIMAMIMARVVINAVVGTEGGEGSGVIIDEVGDAAADIIGAEVMFCCPMTEDGF